MKKLSAHPAAAQARIEKIRRTRLRAPAFKYTNRPNPRLTENANNRNNLAIINLDSEFIRQP
jgi:hypothetical protein